MIDQHLIERLVCPETHTKLTVADPPLLEKVNQAIAAGVLTNRSGEKMDQPISVGLVRADGKVMFPVFDDIPNMLIDQSIELDQLPRSTSD